MNVQRTLLTKLIGNNVNVNTTNDYHFKFFTLYESEGLVGIALLEITVLEHIAGGFCILFYFVVVKGNRNGHILPLQFILSSLLPAL